MQHGDCANAVGAAIAQVSGECDQIFKDLSRADALAAAQGIANDRAVAAGAARASLATIESEDMPLAYLPGNSVRVRVRVVGDVAATFVGDEPSCSSGPRASGSLMDHRASETLAVRKSMSGVALAAT